MFNLNNHLYREFHYLPKRMPQEVKDELTYSIPTLIDEILKDGPLFHTAHESLNYIRGQFYEEYVSDILKLIKEHTQNVNFIAIYIKIPFYYSICSFFKIVRGKCSQEGFN